MNVGPSQDVHVGTGRFIVGDGEPVDYTNVQKYGVDYDGRPGFLWWQQLAIMFGTGNLDVNGSNGFVGDLDSGAGTMDIDSTAFVHYLYVEVDSQLAGDGNVTFNSDGFDLGVPAGLHYVSFASSTFDGTLSGPGVVRVDTGSLTLTGANSYTGGTLVDSGALTVGGPASLPGYGVSGSVSVVAGATLTVEAGGNGEWDASSLEALLATTAFASDSTLGIEVDSTNVFTYGSDLASAQAAKNLAKLGAGTLILTATNSLTGTTDIAAGTLQVGNGSTAGWLGSGAVDDEGSLLFDRSDPVTVANAVGGVPTR